MTDPVDLDTCTYCGRPVGDTYRFGSLLSMAGREPHPVWCMRDDCTLPCLSTEELIREMAEKLTLLACTTRGCAQTLSIETFSLLNNLVDVLNKGK